jgi:hypothetical protein
MKLMLSRAFLLAAGESEQQSEKKRIEGRVLCLMHSRGMHNIVAQLYSLDSPRVNFPYYNGS